MKPHPRFSPHFQISKKRFRWSVISRGTSGRGGLGGGGRGGVSRGVYMLLLWGACPWFGHRRLSRLYMTEALSLACTETGAEPASAIASVNKVQRDTDRDRHSMQYRCRHKRRYRQRQTQTDTDTCVDTDADTDTNTKQIRTDTFTDRHRHRSEIQMQTQMQTDAKTSSVLLECVHLIRDTGCIAYCTPTNQAPLQAYQHMFKHCFNCPAFSVRAMSIGFV